MTVTNLDENVAFQEEVSLHNLFESFWRVLELTNDSVLQIVAEHFLRVLERLGLALGRAVHPLVAGLVVVWLRAQNQRLDGDQDLEKTRTVLDRLQDWGTGLFLLNTRFNRV